MQHPLRRILSAVLIAISLFSCREDEVVDPPTPSPYPELSTFLERFVAEGKARGINLDASAVDLVYVDEIKFPDGSTFCGYGWTAHPNTGKRAI